LKEYYRKSSVGVGVGVDKDVDMIMNKKSIEKTMKHNPSMRQLRIPTMRQLKIPTMRQLRIPTMGQLKVPILLLTMARLASSGVGGYRAL
jgi:hypothetical protein